MRSAQAAGVGIETLRARRRGDDRWQRRLPTAAADGLYGITATACSAAAMGLELLARRTRDAAIAVAAKSAAEHLRSVVEDAVVAAAARGVDAQPRACGRTGERLRWEWLASTATVVDGSSDERLLAECARILADAVASTARDDAARGNGARLKDRLRLASAEAYSLSRAVEFERRVVAARGSDSAFAFA